MTTTRQEDTNAQSGIALNLTIGQHVRHRDYKGRRVTGTVKGISIDSEGCLQADIKLDAPIVIEAGEGRPLNIWRQCVPVHELAPFDDRDEVIAELRAALQAMLAYHDDVAKPADQRLLDAGYAALAMLDVVTQRAEA